MPRPYDSFLVRCWDLRGPAARVEVEHFQSGVRVRVDSLAAAAAWIDDQHDALLLPAPGAAAANAPASGEAAVVANHAVRVPAPQPRAARVRR